MVQPFPSPTTAQPDRAAVLVGYLDFFRETVIDKVGGLDKADVRGSRLPSGWSPQELLWHLRHVEQRWLVWGFLGRDVGDPFADKRSGRWFVEDGMEVAEVVEALRAQGRTSTEIITEHDLAQVGRPGPRWNGAAPPTLERICLHLVQEYARHVGQLDVVRELIDGAVGE